MRTFLLFTALFAAAFAAKINFKNKIEIDPKIFEDQILAAIEALRDEIPDPLDVEELDITLPDDLADVATGTIDVSDLDVVGLTGFEVKDLSFNLIGFEIKFTLIFPDLKVATGYSLDVHATEDDADVFGDGKIAATIKDLELKIQANVDLSGGVKVNNLDVQVYLGTASQFSVTGFMNDDQISSDLTDYLNTQAAQYIDDNQAMVSKALDPIVETVINDILASLLG